MDHAIGLPEMKEIETWLGERCHLERARLRNELAFIQGDCACGGPPRDDLAAALKSRLAAIAKRLKTIDSCYSPAVMPQVGSKHQSCCPRAQEE